MITYRKTKAGEWVAFGPVAEFQAGGLRLGDTAPGGVTVTSLLLTVTRKDGTARTETIRRLGRPFTADGTECCYGYLAPAAPRSQARAASRAYGMDMTEYSGGFGRDERAAFAGR